MLYSWVERFDVIGGRGKFQSWSGDLAVEPLDGPVCTSGGDSLCCSLFGTFLGVFSSSIDYTKIYHMFLSRGQ
jgi:hypothetical protein